MRPPCSLLEKQLLIMTDGEGASQLTCLNFSHSGKDIGSHHKVLVRLALQNSPSPTFPSSCTGCKRMRCYSHILLVSSGFFTAFLTGRLKSFCKRWRIVRVDTSCSSSIVFLLSLTWLRARCSLTSLTMYLSTFPWMSRLFLGCKQIFLK